MAQNADDMARMSRESIALVVPFLWPHIAKRVIAQDERLLQEWKKR